MAFQENKQIELNHLIVKWMLLLTWARGLLRRIGVEAYDSAL